MVEIGKKIKIARQARSMSQSELSAQAGVPRSSVSALENGTAREIGIRKVVRICACLGLELRVEQVRQRPNLDQLFSEIGLPDDEI